MAKHPNAVKLDASRVPPWTHSTTLEKEGYAALQESISAKEYVQAGQLKSYYVESSGTPASARKATRAVSLIAKHLRLVGNPLMLVSLSGLLREQRIAYLPREVESANPVLTLRGKGYIAIPDFFLEPNPLDLASLYDLHDVGDFLVSHVYSGGGLILGGLPRTTESLDRFGYEAAGMIRERFEFHTVKG